MTGASGIAWSLSELGLEDRALELMKGANESALLKDHHSYLYGMAGIGMANLHFYVRTNKPEYLAVANELGDALLRSAQESEQGIYWENDGLLHLGYGYGQSGVALFLLRLFQLTGKEKFLYEGRRALEFDLSHGEERENGVLSFPRAPGDPTVVPYLEEGSAGIARVAIGMASGTSDWKRFWLTCTGSMPALLVCCTGWEASSMFLPMLTCSQTT